MGAYEIVGICPRSVKLGEIGLTSVVFTLLEICAFATFLTQFMLWATVMAKTTFIVSSTLRPRDSSLLRIFFFFSHLKN